MYRIHTNRLIKLLRQNISCLSLDKRCSVGSRFSRSEASPSSNCDKYRRQEHKTLESQTTSSRTSLRKFHSQWFQKAERPGGTQHEQD